MTVVDQHDSFMVGLEREQFRLYEDNVEQVITHFSMEDAPVSVGLVLDASASMAGKIWKSQEAVASLLKTANAADEFFLVQFNNRDELVLDLTQDTKTLQNKLMRVELRGDTALFDDITFSIQEKKNDHNT
jgi:Ca-activated chloride channel family protein